MGLGAFAKTGDDADAGDPGFARRLSHRPSASRRETDSGRGFAHLLAHFGIGKSMTLNVSVASQTGLPASLMWPR